MRLAMIYGRARVEEKLLLEAASRKGIALEAIHDDTLRLDLDRNLDVDGVLERSVSLSRSLAILRFLRNWGIPAVNPYDVAAACADKAETSLRLRRAGVATPDSQVAFTPESAIAVMESMGYPVVMKPTVGSWARLVSRIDNRHEAEQILEHREMLPNPQQQVYYIQRYIKKQAGTDGAHRDMRAFVIGDETIAAIWRSSPHWITNTARGATTSACTITPELHELCQRAAESVGGGVLALDLMEGPDGLMVHEINHTMEFRNSIAPTGIDIPGRILDHLVAEAKR